MKTCSTCKLDKPLDEFHARNASIDGKSYVCNKCDSARKKTYHAANKNVRQRQGLRKKFGMTLDDYDRMLADQDGLCGNVGCFNAPDPSRRCFAVDHDRKCCPGEKSCGQCIRAILCLGCNTALGLLNEDVDRLLGLIKYLTDDNRQTESFTLRLVR